MTRYPGPDPVICDENKPASRSLIIMLKPEQKHPRDDSGKNPSSLFSRLESWWRLCAATAAWEINQVLEIRPLLTGVNVEQISDAITTFFFLQNFAFNSMDMFWFSVFIWASKKFCSWLVCLFWQCLLSRIKCQQFWDAKTFLVCLSMYFKAILATLALVESVNWLRNSHTDAVSQSRSGVLSPVLVMSALDSSSGFEVRRAAWRFFCFVLFCLV